MVKRRNLAIYIQFVLISIRQQAGSPSRSSRGRAPFRRSTCNVPSGARGTEVLAFAAMALLGSLPAFVSAPGAAAVPLLAPALRA